MPRTDELLLPKPDADHAVGTRSKSCGDAVERTSVSCCSSSEKGRTAMSGIAPATQRRLGKVPDVSRIGNWSDKTTRRLIDAGKLPGVIRIGRMVRVDLDILGRWIEQGCPHLHRFSGRA